jgi:hypothetical protein
MPSIIITFAIYLRIPKIAPLVVLQCLQGNRTIRTRSVLMGQHRMHFQFVELETVESNPSTSIWQSELRSGSRYGYRRPAVVRQDQNQVGTRNFFESTLGQFFRVFFFLILRQFNGSDGHKAYYYKGET